jgi:CHAT domain-containing protein/Tfp pilus assembly protein PilF
MMKLAITFLMSTIFYAISAQNFDSLVSKGNQSNKNGKYDSAVVYFNTAAELPTNNKPQRFQALQLLGITYLKKNEFQEAWKVTERMEGSIPDDKSQIDFLILRGRIDGRLDRNRGVIWFDSVINNQTGIDQLTRAYMHKGVLQIFRHEMAQAQVCYDSAMELMKSYQADTIVFTGVMELGGRIKLKTGDFNGALRQFQGALEIKKLYYGEFHPEIAFLTGNIGIIYKNLLQYDKALEYYGISLEFRKRYLGEDHVDVSNMYNNIGYVFYLKDQFDEARDYHTKAYNIRVKKLPENHALVLQSIEHLGLCHGGKREFKEAEEKFRRILQARIDKFGYDHHYVGYALYNLGAVAVEERDFKKAGDYFKEAIDIGYKVYGEYNYDQADNFNRYAKCLLAEGKYEEAAQNFYLGIKFNTPGYVWDGKLGTIPDEIHYLSYREILRSYIGLAYSYSGMNDYELASVFLEKSEQLIYDFKLRITNDKDLIRISRSYKELADCGIAVLYKEFDRTNGTSDITDIFRYSELAKASSLLAKINENKARNISDIPESEINIELNFRTTKDSLTNKVLQLARQNITDESLQETKRRLFETNRDYEVFLDSLERTYPKYANNKYGRNSATLETIQKSLTASPGADGLISYNLTDDKELMIAAVTADTFLISYKTEEQLVDLIATFRASLEKQTDDVFEKSSRKLYQTLVEPVEQSLLQIDKLVIIPDGIIGFIPFETLLNSEDTYLFENLDISYEPSSTLLINRNPIEQTSSADLLAYAPEFESQQMLAVNDGYQIPGLRSESLGALPGAKKEVAQISNHFTSSTLIGDEATEKHFKDEAPKYDILHFATHSVVNEKNADYTRLYFKEESPTDTTSTEDGFLHAFELNNIELNARLVTLSACNTGFGKVEEGEGVMSLARSFTAAGVPSVVMSLWPASDKSTPELMESFYENLADGMTKDKALNEARRAYLKKATGKARHPFYWGGFVLIGDTEPLQAKSNNWIWFVLFGVVTVLVIGYFFKR